MISLAALRHRIEEDGEGLQKQIKKTLFLKFPLKILGITCLDGFVLLCLPDGHKI
jgi:hypothetical protein